MKRRHQRALGRVLGLVATVCSALACDGGVRAAAGPGGGGRGVLVVAVDGLRADRLGVNGYARETTPTLDALAERGVRFTRVFAAAPLTRPAHVALLTGCDPTVALGEFQSDANDAAWNIPERVPALAVEFLAAGFRTAAFLDEAELIRSRGFDRGFQRVLVAEATDYRWGHRAEGQIARFAGWLRGVGSGASWFAYLHLSDLERSWSQPAPSWETYYPPLPGMDFVLPPGNTDSVFFAVPFSRWRGQARTLGAYEAAYDGHLNKLDADLDALFATLRRMGVDERTTVAVVGTHGVEFGEGGLYLRSGMFTLADLAVPLVLRPARGLESASLEGVVVDAVASTIDLAPTLLDLHGIARPAEMQGVSQRAALTDATARPREFAFASCGRLIGGAVFDARYCLESIAPAYAQPPLLRRAWFGEDEVDVSAGAAQRFYDHIATPFPALGATLDLTQPPPGFPVEDYTRLSEAWTRFEHDLTAARAAFGSIGGTE